jgi:Zn-finger protein
MMRGRTSTALSALVVTFFATSVFAAISGVVVDDETSQPIVGATVHLQADPSGPVTTTAADGSFSLAVAPAGSVVVTAAVVYDATAPRNWATGGATAVAGANDVEIRLEPIPDADNANYENELPSVSLCGSCHPDQLGQWAQSNHAVAGNDAWVLDLYSGTGTPGGGAGYVFIDTHDENDSGLCAACHTPMADVFDPGQVRLHEVTSGNALQGVSCVACHQVHALGPDVNGFNHIDSVEYRFPEGDGIPTALHVWGPLDDVSFNFMRTAYAPIFAQSEVCAACHEYQAPSGAPGQETYSEWLASPYAQPGPGFRSCQDCHMPTEDGPGPVSSSSPVVRPAEQRHRHDFVGATEEGLSTAILMETTAVQDGAELEVVCRIENAGAGHSFPSGVSVRNALLVVEATLDGASLPQSAGPTVPFWADDDVPGIQDGDYAGRPGTGFAKVLEGRINGQGGVVRPVLFIDAEGVWEDSLIEAGEIRTVTLRFDLPVGTPAGEQVDVDARLLYRRAWRAVAVTKGWTETPQGGPIEIEVHRQQPSLILDTVQQAPAIPVSGPVGWAVLIGVVAMSAWVLLRRLRG